MVTIYRITNKVNGKIYIGKTVQKLNNRWNAHISRALRGSSWYLSKAIRKYGSSCFLVEKLDTTESVLQANWLESLYIGLLRSNNPSFGYNQTFGGDGKIGYKTSEQTKEKIRRSNVGQKRSSETIEKLRLSHLGNVCSLGRVNSEETRKKMGLPKKGKPWPESRRLAQNFKNDFACYFGNEISKLLKGK